MVYRGTLSGKRANCICSSNLNRHAYSDLKHALGLIFLQCQAPIISGSAAADIYLQSSGRRRHVDDLFMDRGSGNSVCTR